MKHSFKLAFLIYFIVVLVISSTVTFIDIAFMLMITAFNVYREKYNNSIYIITAEFILSLAAMQMNPVFVMVLGLTCFDIIYKKLYIGITAIAAAAAYYSYISTLPILLLVISISGIAAYYCRLLDEKEQSFNTTYDKERQYRYELEQAKAKLLNSAREVAHIAEVNERNRIAREVHDNLGHSIAGVLMQLQAADKLSGRDDAKSRELLRKSIDNLSGALTVLRDTVYNIKPQENLGIEYIKNVIDNFSFCKVDFKHTGDFNRLRPNQLEILCTNIKEALTNASKYSNATKVDINIDINDKFLRLYIKDNGFGCQNIKEGLGISGMKERIRNIGGSFSISSEEGFLIVCIIPVEYRGGGIFEGSNR